MINAITTKDGSNTLFSSQYNQHYHNIDDGAKDETLSKHVIPSFTFHKDKKELNILDICFGLGYNTLYTIWYIKEHNLNKKVTIYSPELDKELVESLKDFTYPKELENLKPIVEALSSDFYYEDEDIKIIVHIGDAREFLKELKDVKFDIIYQDAFSSEVNNELWTKEYFDLLYNLSCEDTIMTTYSIATPVRLSMYKAGFFIYQIAPVKKKQTLCFTKKQDVIGKYIDMDLKQQRNPSAKALYDKS